LLLTNAHVVFGGLYNCFEGDRHLINSGTLDKFNQSFLFGTYLRDDEHMDYTFVRPKRSCFVSQNHNMIEFKDKKYALVREKFSEAVIDAWKVGPACFVGGTVLKCGMCTGVTFGKIHGYDYKKVIFEIQNVDGIPFSAPGDSGSLVYLVEETRFWREASNRDV
jgi:hypothetical protein